MGLFCNKITEFFVSKNSDKETPSYFQLQHKHINNLVVLPTRLDMLKQLPKKSIVAEIGVAKGRFSEKILKITEPKILHLIDSWKSKDFGCKARLWVEDKFTDQIKLGTVKLHNGKSVSVLEKFPDKYFDWVYIDTDHTYQTTKNELESCKNKIKDGGIIAGHDYTTRNYRDGRPYGVVEAVNEFCYKFNWQFNFITHETHRHISFAIKEI